MYSRGDYLKKAFYHLMKMEMKNNKKLGYDDCGLDNAKLSRNYAKYGNFQSELVYTEDGELFVHDEFFKLSTKEQNAIIQYMTEK